jgi:hypothetical protein
MVREAVAAAIVAGAGAAAAVFVGKNRGAIAKRAKSAASAASDMADAAAGAIAGTAGERLRDMLPDDSDEDRNQFRSGGGGPPL